MPSPSWSRCSGWINKQSREASLARKKMVKLVFYLLYTDDSLEQQLVLPVEAAQISLFQSICFQQNQNVLILQGWVHAVTRHLQHRQQVRCQQHRNGCHNDQRIGGAFQHTLVTPAVRQAFALLHDLLHRGNLNAFSAQSLHFQYAPSLFAVGENSVPCTGYCALTDSKY